MKTRRLHHNQAAFVSIFTVMIIMSILTLITIGFSNITRRAQQRVLNNQLNTQAYYAAESGVNEAIAALKANPALTKNTCRGPGFNYDNNLDANLNVGYTCVLIKSQDPTQVFTDVPLEGSASPIVSNFQLSTGEAPEKFDVIWSAHTNSAATVTNTGTSLLPLSQWTSNKYLGLVRIDLAPIDQAGVASLDRASLATKGFSFYLYGTNSVPAGTQTLVNNTPDQGGLVFANCTTTTCTAHLKFSPATAKAYKMRLQSVYAPVDVTIANGVDVNGSSGSWVGGQAVIDVTGKANDVLRRIQVRVPLVRTGASASYGLQTADSICKRIAALSGNAYVDDSTDDACQIN